ncbi:MAG: SRPBCC domain-containing protein [Saccharofermentanales bacterium]
MSDSFCISKVFQTTPQKAFEAWLDSKTHSAFTGAEAVIDPAEGGDFTAWDGYIYGKTTLIEKYSRILQNWRTTDFADSDADSILEIRFEQSKNGTKITLCHSNLPEEDGQKYKDGWKDFYFDPMTEYFNF